MEPKAKDFDCVRMKQQAQEKLRAEYELQRGRFASYAEFLSVTVNEEPWQRQLWAKAGAPSSREATESDADKE